jgi:hypothetical protein
MKRLALISFLLFPILVLAKNDPAMDARKTYVEKYQKMLEQSGGTCSRIAATIAGKNKDSISILTIHADVAFVITAERSCVEPQRAEMKALGFHTIEIRSDAYSSTFPKGIWRISLDEDGPAKP